MSVAPHPAELDQNVVEVKSGFCTRFVLGGGGFDLPAKCAKDMYPEEGTPVTDAGT